MKKYDSVDVGPTLGQTTFPSGNRYNSHYIITNKGPAMLSLDS